MNIWNMNFIPYIILSCVNEKGILSCILQAANLPMSIIIVGVGDADFEGNYKLYE